jgi:Flp pilus assembly protein TadG
MGILVYGQYFMLAHSVQQAANDGARAAITGLDAADRLAVATRAVDRSLAGVRGVSPATRSVAVTFTVPEGAFIRSSFVPSPGNVIRADATFELPAE